MKKHLALLLLIMTGDCLAQASIYDELKNTVYHDWITAYPAITKTQTSYFNKTNANKYFVAPLQISGFNIPFTWDSDLSILEFLTDRDSKLIVKKGTDADTTYKGTRIVWNKPESALIWIQDKAYKSTISDWYLFGLTDCPGTHLFPIVNFEKIFELPYARTNQLWGLVIIPYNAEIRNISKTETKLTTTTGKEIQGTGYDINGDKILDIFKYYEPLDPDGMTGYRRLYLNIDGNWTGIWSEYFEECI